MGFTDLMSNMQFLSTPSARRATPGFRISVMDAVFLSTPSARRATTMPTCPLSNFTNFYPRPPRGGRPFCRRHVGGADRFLSTPSARRATPAPHGKQAAPQFLSTPSARRATPGCEAPQREGRISIHALREEGDRAASCIFFEQLLFLSTPSARRATYERRLRDVLVPISIHALREEGDSKNRDKISIFKQIIQHSARI